MRIEIKCAHSRAMRVNCLSGWICDTERGGCGATGNGENGDWYPVIAYFDLPDDMSPATLAVAAAKATGAL